MSKFNTSTVSARNGEGVIKTTGETGRNAMGSVGFARDEKSELFLSCVSDFVEDTFYETSAARQSRVRNLVTMVAVNDPQWIAEFILWLRNTAQMRSISLVVALEAADALRKNGVPGGRTIVSNALARADEPGEALAYWVSQKGRKIPAAVKRGISDAAVRLYNEYSVAKYDSDAKGFTIPDVIKLVHPKPDTIEQADLFKYAMERKFDNTTAVPESLGMLRARKEYLSMDKKDLRNLLKSDGGSAALKHAGLTWEAVAGTVGLDAEIWEALIPNMGYMALIRNLRNFEKEGVSDVVLDEVARRLADPNEVAKSRQLPFRFLSAYNATKDSLRFGYPLEKALEHSLQNVPALKGNTLILVDRSVSMFGAQSKNTGLNFADAAAIFGTALAVRAEKADLVQYGMAHPGYGNKYLKNHEAVNFTKQSSVLKTLEKFRDMGGTDTPLAVRENFKNHDRVIIITDEQYYGRGTHPAAELPSNTPVFTFNLAGYKYGQDENKPNRYTFGGLTDQSFKLIPLLEKGHDQVWPWES